MPTTVEERPGGLLELHGALEEREPLLALARSDRAWQPTAYAAFTARPANTRSLELAAVPEAAPLRALVERELLPAANRRWGLALRDGAPQAHLVRYEVGETYPPHYDHLGTPERFFSAIAYLNDDYRGGETVFPELKVEVEPRAGKVILFPSHYFHYSAPVTAGTKYVAVTFLLGTRPGSRR
jgi:predicted 2-oxoglutarate/Fe(II)-dependent dioxygenase YbiX